MVLRTKRVDRLLMTDQKHKQRKDGSGAGPGSRSAGGGNAKLAGVAVPAAPHYLSKWLSILIDVFRRDRSGDRIVKNRPSPPAPARPALRTVVLLVRIDFRPSGTQLLSAPIQSSPVLPPPPSLRAPSKIIYLFFLSLKLAISFEQCSLVFILGFFFHPESIRFFVFSFKNYKEIIG